MEALLYADWDVLRIEDVPLPEPGDGEVRLKVQAAGICGSELDAVRKHSPRRTPPLILGHEFTGVIDKMGSGVENWLIGDEVVANAIIADGTCPACLRGQKHLCASRRLFGMHLPGAFAQFVVTPVSTLVKRPRGLSPEIAALAEPLANGIHVANLLADVDHGRVIVFGAGPIGLFVMQALKVKFGSLVAVVDRIESRLALAIALGADVAFVPGDAGLSEWCGEDGVPASVDAVGAEATKAASISLVRPGGTAVWIGLYENASPFNAYDLILPEKRVIGSYACSQEELSLALDWMATTKVDAKSWISKFVLSESGRAFQTMLNPGPKDVKAVITMS